MDPVEGPAGKGLTAGGSVRQETGDRDMRFMHLADLHLGKIIYGTSLIDSGDQRVWAERFLEAARKEKPDAVVIAGDVYDRGTPPGKAAQLLSRLVTELAGMGIAVMITAGNHDSIQHLSFLSRLLAESRVFISRPPEAGGKLTRAVLEDEYGPVTFWLMPYLYPAMAAQALGDDGIRDYDTAVRRILAAQDIDFSQRNVIVAHQNVTANGKEAERGGSESMVGGIGQVDYSAFDGFEYAALGHIHSAYPAGRAEVRYAGSPLAYHFNETRQPEKGPLLVTLGAKGRQAGIERLDIEPLHRMREIRGEYEAVRAEAVTNPWKNEYLKIVLTDRRISPEISDFLHEAARAHGSTLMELTSEYRAFSAEAGTERTGDMRGKPVEQLFAEFYTDRNGGIGPDDPDTELMAFVGGMTRRTAETNEEPNEADFRKILDFIAEQEADKV